MTRLTLPLYGGSADWTPIASAIAREVGTVYTAQRAWENGRDVMHVNLPAARDKVRAAAEFYLAGHPEIAWRLT